MSIGTAIQRSSDRILAGGTAAFVVSLAVILIIGLFLVPLPPSLLDLLLVLNLGISLILLLRSLSVGEPMALIGFPSVLLIGTLFRLALNISSTRLILLHGDKGLDVAGHVIESFGKIVVQGEFGVGIIIFAIIATVNFLVITKGAARVAEVAARFTLDALPGKQLAIDADLRSGLITTEQSAAERLRLAQESQFYGAMDGAMKFVQGDAIASMVIVLINCVGGIGFGLSRGLSFAQARDSFGILAVGDGLVSIIPSLIVSVCAGIVVTHVSGMRRPATSLTLARTLFSDRRSVFLGALALCLFGMLPGFPLIPLFGVALAMVILLFATSSAGLLDRLLGSQGSAEDQQPIPPPSPSSRPRISQPVLELSAGASVTALFSTGAGSGASDAWRLIADKTRAEIGIELPHLQVSSDHSLQAEEYQISIRGSRVRAGKVNPSALGVCAPESLLKTLGAHVLSIGSDPMSGQSMCWIAADDPARPAVEHLGPRVERPEGVICGEVIRAALEQIEDLFGLDDAHKLIAALKSECPILVETVLETKLVSEGEVTDLLRRLLRERVSIRDLRLIFEAIAEFAATSPLIEQRQEWLSQLHQHVRLVLSRQIVRTLVGSDGRLRVFALAPEVEKEFRSAISMWDSPRIKPPLDPDFEDSLTENIQDLFTPPVDRGMVPIVVLCHGDIRLAVEEYLHHQFLRPYWVRTLSFQELNGHVEPESLGIVSA